MLKHLQSLLFLTFCGVSTLANGQTNIPVSGSISITSCSTRVYDSGGANGAYVDDSEGSLTINPAIAGNKVRITFVNFNTELDYDKLRVYDGTSVSATLIGEYSGTSLPSSITATNVSGALTVRFSSDYSDTYAGFAFDVSCVNTTTAPSIPSSGNLSITTCSTMVYDNGGVSGNYFNNSNGSITINPLVTGNKVKITFTNFDTETSYDYLRVYDGTSISASLIGEYSGNTLPNSITASNTTGALTIRFTSDNTTTRAGFAFDVSCVTIAPGLSIPSSGNSIITTCSTKVYDNGGGAGNYLNSSDGSLTINPGVAGNKVKIKFTDFNTELGYDYLRVYDGTSTSANLIGEYSGSSMPNNITATNTTGALTVRFSSDYADTDAGFAFDVSCVSNLSEFFVPKSGISTISVCNATVYDNGGSDGEYSSFSNGTLIINPSASGSKVKLSFLEMHTELNYDTLNIYDGNSINANLVGTFSGTRLPSSITATSNTGALTLRFKSDESITYGGFKIAVTCESTSNETKIPTTGNTTLTTCNKDIFDNGGSLGSYSSNSSGSMTFFPEESGKKLKIMFKQFALESGQDSIFVYDGINVSSPLLGKFSGLALPPHVVAINSSGALTVQFKSNATTNLAGFCFNVSCAPNEYLFPVTGNRNITTCDGLFYDNGGLNNDYAENSSSVVTINPSSSTSKVQISFLEFDTEEDYDTLNVFDGPSTSSVLIATFSGSVLPPSITSTHTGGALTLQFKSDGSFNQPGFVFKSECVGGVVSVNDLEVMNESLIYPNPNSGSFHINMNNFGSEGSDLKVFDLKMSLVHTQKIEPNHDATVNIEHLSKGIYIVELASSHHKIIRQKLIIN